MARSCKPESARDAREDRELTTLIGTGLGDGEVPQRLVVAPWGEVESTAGRFVVDDEAGRLVVEAFGAHGTDLPIDYEHQTLGGSYASPRGTAPAAGWITALQTVAGEGIVATVNWTEEARKMLAAKEYRYLSPVAVVRKSDRKLVALHSVALTNKPAITRMEAIVNKERGEAEALADARLAALCAKLNVPTEEGLASLLVAADQRLEVLETESLRHDAEALVAAALAEGKLTEPQRDWALTLALKERALFDQWMQTAPVVVRHGRTPPPASNAAGRAGEEAVAHGARMEYRSCPALRGLTSEESYVAHALRQHAG